jgi:DNA-binding transcriptional MerR regulator
MLTDEIQGGGCMREHLLTISDFAKIVDISPSTLRYYDTIGLFSPAVSGAESGNSYRYYSPMQITTVKMVRVLTELGVPLKIILEVVKERTPAKILRLLDDQSSRLYARLCHLQESHSVLRVYTGLLRDGITAEENELSVIHMAEMPITLGPPCEFGDDPNFYREFVRFCSQTHTPPLNMCYPIGGVFNSMDVFLNAPSQPSHFFSTDPVGTDRKKEGLYLVGYTRGYYGQTNDLPERLADHAKEHALVFDGPVYNLYLFDEVSVDNPEKYLLQAAAAIRNTL